MKNLLSYPSIIRLHIQLALAWGVAAFLLELTSQLQLTYQLPDNYILGYGLVRPALHVALIFGVALNLLFGHGYSVVSSKEKQSILWPPLGLGLANVLNASLLGGIGGIFLRWNTGREYGEIPFLFANGIMLALVGLLVLLIASTWKVEKPGLPLMTAVFLVAGLLAFFLLGNLGLPIHPLLTVSLFQGVQDAALQEFYRTGLLALAIILPTVAIMYSWQKRGDAPQAYGALVLLVGAGAALAGWSGLLHSPAHPVLQTAGSALGLFFAVTVLAASVLLWQTGSTENVSDHRLIQKYSAVVLGFLSLLLALSSVRSTAGLFQYTYWNSKDLAQIAFLLLIPAAVALGGKNQSARSGIPLTLLLTGLVLSLAANVLQGSMQAFFSPAESWLATLFQGQLFVEKTESIPAYYWYSLRSLYFLGRLMALVGLLWLALRPAAKESGAADDYLLVEADR